METTALLRTSNVVEVSHIDGVGWAPPVGKSTDLTLPSVFIAGIEVNVENVVRSVVISARELQAVSSTREDCSVLDFELFFYLVVYKKHAAPTSVCTTAC
jgi:hypothetical protein